MKFYGFHGAIAEERTLGQMFLVDIDAWVSLKKAGESDNLEDTISYVDIFRLAKYIVSRFAFIFKLYSYDYVVDIIDIVCSLAKEIVEGSPRNLLETVAELIASKTLEKFHQINAVRVKLSKPNVALIKSTIDYLGVDIFRQRNTSSKN